MGIPLRQQFHTQRKRVILGAGVAFLALQLGFCTFPPRIALLLVQYGGYAAMLLTFVLLAGLVARMVLWPDLWHRCREGGWKIVLLVVGLSLFLHVQEQHGFKVVNDELLQLSTSQRMHAERMAHTVSRGYELGTNFVLMQGGMDKRPLFFPFLLSLVHDLTGYRPENAFVLNALLTPIFLGLLYWVVRRVRGVAAGVAAVVLCATIPLLTQAATGGGFELLNLVMILATVWLGMRYAEEPTGVSLSAFCLSGILLAQVRYESVLFVLPVAVMILWTTWRSGRLLLPWTLLLAPFLLVLYPLQYNVFKLQPILWQLADRSSEHGVYSMAYFYDNVGRALRYFFSWDHSQPNSHLVALGGIIGLGFFWMWLYRHYRTLSAKPGTSAFVVFLLALCLQAGLMLCYFWGAYDDVLTVRLSLPTQLLFVLALAFVYPELVTARWRWRALIAVSGFYLMGWTMPTLARRAYAHENLAAETCNWYRDYLRERPDRNCFVIEPRMPLLWLAYDVPSMDFDVLAARAKEFLYHYQRGTFDECLVVQRMMITDFAMARLVSLPGHDLGLGVRLEPVRQIQLTPTYYMRISRIVSLDEKALLAWAEQRKAEVKTKAGEEMSSSKEDDARSRREAEYTGEWLRNLP